MEPLGTLSTYWFSHRFEMTRRWRRRLVTTRDAPGYAGHLKIFYQSYSTGKLSSNMRPLYAVKYVLSIQEIKKVKLWTPQSILQKTYLVDKGMVAL